MKTAFIIEPRYRYYVASVVDRLVEGSDDGVLFFGLEDADGLSTRVEEFDILITIHTLSANIVEIFSAAKGRRPTLTIQDGIIEHHHCWEILNREVQRYRPILSDKLAVFGERSRAILMSWGARPDQIVVTGSPRFDEYAQPDPGLQGTYILLTCANTPFRNSVEQEAFLLAFDSLIRICTARRLTYRLRLPPLVRRGIRASQLDIEPLRRACKSHPESRPLIADLAEAAAVVTTPSTVALESMAMSKPTALVHPRHLTVYLSSPWNIRTADDAEVVLSEILAPPAEKMRYQSLIFQENVATGSDATANVCELIRRMAASNSSPRSPAA